MIRIILVFFLLVSFMTSFSQNIVDFGVKAGLNLSTLKNEGKVSFGEFDYKSGLLAGVHLSVQPWEKFGFRIEFLYSQEGGKNKDNNRNIIEFSRLSIPVFFRYSPISPLIFQGGPELKLTLTNNTIHEELNEIDFGGSLGVEFRPIKKISIFIRNYFGLTYHGSIIHRKNRDGTGTSYKIFRSNVFSFGLNYYLN